MIKKIEIKFKSGFITPIESDTLLGYIFAKDFQKLSSVFQQFESGEVPFVFSNGYDSGFISKPVFFLSKDGYQEEQTLDSDLKNERIKKNIKKQQYMLFTEENLKLFFETGQQRSYQENLEEPLSCVISENKNSIPRFGEEANPYTIKNINYSYSSMTIYVKILDETAFDLFFQSMKKILESIGWGKGVTRGYGKIEECSLSSLNEQEQSAFEYLKQLEEKNIKFVLNNYKPTDEEIADIDLDKSYLLLTNKNTKSLQNQIFKGNMKFIAPGSVLVKKNNNREYRGSFYQVASSFNFGYIF